MKKVGNSLIYEEFENTSLHSMWNKVMVDTFKVAIYILVVRRFTAYWYPFYNSKTMIVNDFQWGHRTCMHRSMLVLSGFISATGEEGCWLPLWPLILETKDSYKHLGHYYHVHFLAEGSQAQSGREAGSRFQPVVQSHDCRYSNVLQHLADMWSVCSVQETIAQMEQVGGFSTCFRRELTADVLSTALTLTLS
jgi:hypothetical protein